MTNQIKLFLVSDDGPTAVEYAVMLALIMGVIAGAISTLGGGTGNLLQDSNTQMTNAGFGS